MVTFGFHVDINEFLLEQIFQTTIPQLCVTTTWAGRGIHYFSDPLTRHETAFLKPFLSGLYAGVILHVFLLRNNCMDRALQLDASQSISIQRVLTLDESCPRSVQNLALDGTTIGPPVAGRAANTSITFNVNLPCSLIGGTVLLDLGLKESDLAQPIGRLKKLETKTATIIQHDFF